MRRARYKETDPGGFFDLSTMKGTVRAIAFVLIGSIFIWIFYDLVFWVYSMIGVEYTPPSEREIRVKRFWALVMSGAMLFSGLGNILWLYFYRKNSIKSARGQWYDRPGLTKEDLYEDEEEASSDK